MELVRVCVVELKQKVPFPWDFPRKEGKTLLQTSLQVIARPVGVSAIMRYLLPLMACSMSIQNYQ